MLSLLVRTEAALDVCCRESDLTCQEAALQGLGLWSTASSERQ